MLSGDVVFNDEARLRQNWWRFLLEIRLMGR